MASVTGKITKVEATASGTTYTVTTPGTPPTETKFAFPVENPQNNQEKWLEKGWDKDKDVTVTYDEQTPPEDPITSPNVTGVTVS